MERKPTYGELIAAGVSPEEARRALAQQGPAAAPAQPTARIGVRGKWHHLMIMDAEPFYSASQAIWLPEELALKLRNYLPRGAKIVTRVQDFG